MKGKQISALRRIINQWKVKDLPWRQDKFVGYDLEGNMYFEGPSRRAGTTLPRRAIEYVDGRADLARYESQKLPVQWMAWLRHTRADPPTIQEIIEAEEKKKQTLALAAEMDRKWEQERAELQAQQAAQAITESSSHEPETISPQLSANAQPAQQQETITEPSGQGETFQPGAWAPTQPQSR